VRRNVDRPELKNVIAAALENHALENHILRETDASSVLFSFTVNWKI
jgi:hypothetical protein